MEHKETRQNPDVINQLALIGLVPVVKVENPEDAVPLCQALERGGLPVAKLLSAHRLPGGDSSGA